MKTPIFHDTQSRGQRLAQLAHEVAKAGSLAELFLKLSATRDSLGKQEPRSSSGRAIAR